MIFGDFIYSEMRLPKWYSSDTVVLLNSPLSADAQMFRDVHDPELTTVATVV